MATAPRQTGEGTPAGVARDVSADRLSGTLPEGHAVSDSDMARAGQDVAAPGPGCVVVVRGTNYDQLLPYYVDFLGANEGELKLREEYFPIITEARKRTGVMWSNFYSHRDRATFFVEKVDGAHALASAMLDLLHEANAKVNLASRHKQITIGIATIRTAPGVSTRGAVETGKQAIEAANELVNHEGADEVRMTEAAFARLSDELRIAYGPREVIGEDAMGEPVACVRRRRGLDAEAAVGNQRCVMSVDMSQFSRIQMEFSSSLGRRQAQEQVQRLADQIQDLVKDGFHAAGSSFKQACLKFAGDGGIFVFDDVEEAHRVAVQILIRAEEENKDARETNSTTGLRCFRVGIAYGPLSADRAREVAGTVIATAVRLESGGPSGEIRMTAEAYARLSKELKALYGGEEGIRGKGHDRLIRSRRYAVTLPAPWAERGPDGAEYPSGKCPPPTPNPDCAVAAPKAALRECFVISPIDPNDPRIADVFDNLIVPACREAGFEPRRADQIAGPDRMEVITGRLSDAPMAIAYLGRPTPGWRQDVVLEVGYRMAKNKPLVLLSESPVKGPDGKIPTFKELLPFHLVHETVTEVPDRPASAVHKLAQELHATRDRGAEGKWTSPFAFMEVKFTNLATDMRITEVSPKARELLGEDYFSHGDDLVAMRAAMQARMGEKQFSACRKSFREMLITLEAQLNGYADDAACNVPLSGVPMVFNEEAAKPAGEPRIGHLPVIVRHTIEGTTKIVRILYLPVSNGLKMTPQGYYICEL